MSDHDQIIHDWYIEQRPLLKGGQGRSARSVYDTTTMTVYAVCAISAIIIAGWLLTAAIGGPQ